MDYKQYAPVIIPTLNRYIHFERCLESLENCVGANLTDVYIGLDFPPSEKYVDGWKKIDNYLKEKENSNRFHQLVVFRRDHNCGMGKPGSNSELLRIFVKQKYSCFIFSEDDNEFAPNFLEFMNKGFELYKEDDRITYICGYTSPMFSNLCEESSFLNFGVSAYGLGEWTYKNWAPQYTNEKLSSDLKQSFVRLVKLYCSCPGLISMCIGMLNRNAQYGDIRYSLYNLLHDKFVLQPTISLVRNWGCDGSGLHSGVNLERAQEQIQNGKTFELTRLQYSSPKGVKKAEFYNHMPKSKIRFFAYFLLGFVRLLKFYLKK